MTLMGQKRDPNKPRKPLRGSRIARKVKTTSDKAKAEKSPYELFMEGFRGMPSIVSGKTHSSILRDSKGNYLPTEGHHILPRSVYPEYAMEEWNIAVLTREEHGHAEDHPKEFRHWLHDHHPLRAAKIEEHRHHRRDR